MDLAFEASLQLNKWDDALSLGDQLSDGYRYTKPNIILLVFAKLFNYIFFFLAKFSYLPK